MARGTNGPGKILAVAISVRQQPLIPPEVCPTCALSHYSIVRVCLGLDRRPGVVFADASPTIQILSHGCPLEVRWSAMGHCCHVRNSALNRFRCDFEVWPLAKTGGRDADP